MTTPEAVARRDRRALSPWDSVPGRLNRFWNPPVPLADQWRRAEARTAGPNRLLASGPAQSDTEAACLARDINERRERWRSILGVEVNPSQSEPPSPSDAAPRCESTDDPVFGSLRDSASNFGSGFFPIEVGALGIVLFLVLGIVGAIVSVVLLGGAVLAARPRLRRRLAGALRNDACPKCSYDLLGLSDDAGFEQRLQVRLGPRACPECGAAWPLVPSPIESPTKGTGAKA